jgi:hypothetical protein
VDASFAIAQESETKLTFNGGTSTTEAGDISEYKWEFSNETGSKTGKEVSQTFAVPGKYQVTLTVTNNSGAVGVSEQEITVKSPPTTTTALTSATGSEAPVKQYTASEIAKLLGVPGNGAKRSGAGAISFGKATCPPACGVYAQILTAVREHGRTRHIQIGALQEVVAGKGSRAISLRLTAKGKQLLRARHALAVALDVTVEDAAGADWRIERHLTLTTGASASRH